MTVRELQQKLSTLDPNLEVLCYSEDEILQSEGRGFRLFDIESVSSITGEKVRLEDNTPYLKLGESPTSESLAILMVISDF